MKRLLAFDLDGTLLNRNGTLSDENREALEKAIEKGVKICIATGRAFHTIPKELLDFPGITYAITNNGAAVYKIEEREQIYSLVLEADSVEEVLEITKEYPAVYEAFIKGTAYAEEKYVKDPVRFGATPAAVHYVQTTRTMVKDMPHFILEHKEELDSLDIVVCSDQIKEQVMTTLREKIAKIYVTSSVKQLVEVSHRDGGKGNGLRFLGKHLGYEKEEIIAFGDAENDIDLLKAAGTGIAMGNASDALKEVADLITTHHNENGVAYALRELLAMI